MNNGKFGLAGYINAAPKAGTKPVDAPFHLNAKVDPNAAFFDYIKALAVAEADAIVKGLVKA